MRVLFCLSGIGRGHVARCRPLARALLRDGHDCTAAVPGRRAGAVLADTCRVITPPAGYRERVAPIAPERPAYVDVHDLEAALGAYQRDAADGLAATLEFLDGAIAETRPDVVVVDQILGAAPLARARGCRVVQVSQPPMLPGWGPWARWRPERDPAVRTPAGEPMLAAALAAVGAGAPPSLEATLEGDLVIVPAHPVFGTAAEALHVRAEDAGEAPGAPAAGAAVAVYLGGGAESLAGEIVAGVLAAGARAHVLDGERLPLAAEVRQDPRVRVSGRVDMQAALAASAAVVHHGGSGTAHACLLAGRPSVAVPTNTEQEHGARTLERCGAGVHVPVSERPLEPFALGPGVVTLSHPQAEGLAARVAPALSALLADPDAPARAGALGDEVRALPAMAAAAGRVERLPAEAAR